MLSKILEVLFVMMMTATITTPRLYIVAKKFYENPKECQLCSDLETYVEEANYPDNEDLNVIQRDLIETLELEECEVSRKP